MLIPGDNPEEGNVWRPSDNGQNPAQDAPGLTIGQTNGYGLRPYQDEAVEAILAEFEEKNSTLIIMGTGTGKTQVFVVAADRYVKKYGGRIMVIAHRQELIEQAKARFQGLTDLTVGVEMAQQTVLDGPLPDVVIASVQTLQARLKRFNPLDFSLVIVDECHHTPSASFSTPIRYFSQAKILGATATPDRLDGQKLGKIFQSVAYGYHLDQAIREGWLVDICQQQIRVEELDFSHLRTVADDFNQEDLEKLMIKHLHKIVVPIIKESGSRQTLVFCVTINHATLVADMLNEYQPGCAKTLNGKSSNEERARVVQEFKDCKIQFLTNVGIFTEGVDIPITSCVAMARPTKSRALYSQAVGRGTRLYPGKENLLVLDFVGNSGRHKLVSVADIFEPEQNEAIAEELRRLMKEGEGTVLDYLKLRDLAEENVEKAEEAERRKEAELRRREQLLRAQEEIERQKGYRPTVSYSKSILRAFQWGGVEASLLHFTGSQYGSPLPEDVEFLKRHGIEEAGELNYVQVKTIRKAIALRAKNGLCTHKQTLLLARNGFDSTEWTYEQARETLDILASHKWKKPPAALRAELEEGDARCQ